MISLKKINHLFTRIIKIGMLTAGLVVFEMFLLPSVASAAAGSQQGASCTINGKPGVYTSITFTGEHCIPLGDGTTQNNIITIVLKVIIGVMATGVGIAVVAGIVVGGMMYMTARGDAGQVKKGEETIRHAVIGLLLFLGMAAILNFLIPGGLLG